LPRSCGALLAAGHSQMNSPIVFAALCIIAVAGMVIAAMLR
jgi:ABC-type nitrate/sulfonate/bicarbonate transport system permease component